LVQDERGGRKKFGGEFEEISIFVLAVLLIRLFDVLWEVG
jgi:hypothetical protein